MRRSVDENVNSEKNQNLQPHIEGLDTGCNTAVIGFNGCDAGIFSEEKLEEAILGLDLDKYCDLVQEPKRKNLVPI
jgi:hypothetical protein